MSDTPLSPTRAARRERLIDAAERVFLTKGFRGATMEAIAEAADMSKVTLYGYFRDKEAAFAAAAERLVARLGHIAFAELGGQGPVRERVLRALAAKHGIVHDLVRASPFAEDLLEKREPVGAMTATLDARIVEAIAEASGDPDLARIVFAGAAGIADRAASRAEMEADLARLMRLAFPETG
jgi:AcrR family transcriptional regulator